MSIAVGLIVLLALIALVMAIFSGAGKGGPLMLPVAVVLLALALLIGKYPT